MKFKQKNGHWLLKEKRLEYHKLLSEGKKRCNSCDNIKEIDGNFYKSKVGKIDSKCLDCMVHYRKKIKPMTKHIEMRYSLHEKQLKKCPDCKIIKPYSDYGKNKTGYNGVAAVCKICKSISDKKYREKYSEKNRQRKKEYYEKVKHTEKYIEYQKIRNDTRDYKKEYERTMANEFRRFKQRIRQLTNVHLKKRRDWVKKESRTVEILGEDYFVVKEFIERQFLKGMSWENHGKVWHIDHTIPLDAAGDDPDKLKRLFYYENLTPMWWKSNLEKSYFIPDICTLWENPIVPYKVRDLVIVPKNGGVVAKYKLQIEKGTRYGMLEVIGDGESKLFKSGLKRRTLTCKCDCGNIKDISLNSLRQNTVTSCGCLRKIKLLEYFDNRKNNL